MTTMFEKVTSHLGFIKPKTIDLKDSNIAGLGTELEKKVRLDASQKEPAWQNVGTTCGLKIFRIEQFKVVPWPEKDYGMFYTGDSYIVINTWKKPDEPQLYHDIHFWLGLSTTQDEAGTAAYKTVELDDYLGTIPIQHREIQGDESTLFLSYFKHFHVQEGGIESGFKHVEEAKYTTRLFQVRMAKAPVGSGPRRLNECLTIREVPLSYKSLNSGDVFIVDAGLAIIQWNGSKSSPLERQKAAEYCRKIADDRNGKAKISVLEEGDSDSGPFWNAIGGKGPVMSAAEADKLRAQGSFENTLMRLSRQFGKYSFKPEAKGDIKKSQLDSNDVFVIDTGDKVWVWIGKKADKDERRTSMQCAIEYLAQNNRSLTVPISRVMEGIESQCYGFDSAIAV